MADFSLSWQPEDYLDIQWARLPRFLLSALRDFTGLAKGEAIERLFDEQTWSRPAGELEIPLSTIVYNMDLGEVEYFGSASTPELTVGQLVRIGIALPVFIESVGARPPVRRRRHHRPVPGRTGDRRSEHRPRLRRQLHAAQAFQARDVTGWQTHRMGMLQASRQLQQGYHLELARRSQREARRPAHPDRSDRLRPVPGGLVLRPVHRSAAVAGADPQGYRATRRALERFASSGDGRRRARESPRQVLARPPPQL